MDKEKKVKEGEKLIPDVEPRRDSPSKPEMDPQPDRDLEYEENSNEKYRDRTEDEKSGRN